MSERSDKSSKVFSALFAIMIVFAFGFGFSYGMGAIMLKRQDRIIAICAEKNIEPKKCVDIGDAIYGN